MARAGSRTTARGERAGAACSSGHACGKDCGCGGMPWLVQALQRQAGNGAVSAALEAAAAEEPPPQPPSVRSVLREPGAPLPGPTRATMEQALGRDLGAVRVHTGASASAASDALDAHAFTAGSHVV